MNFWHNLLTIFIRIESTSLWPLTLTKTWAQCQWVYSSVWSNCCDAEFVTLSILNRYLFAIWRLGILGVLSCDKNLNPHPRVLTLISFLPESVSYEWGLKGGTISYRFHSDKRPDTNKDTLSIGFITPSFDAVLMRIDSHPGTTNDYLQLEIVNLHNFPL